MVRFRRYRSDSEYIDFLSRVVRSSSKRLDNCDLDQLQQLLQLRQLIDEAIATTAYGLNQNGATWAEIGEAVGMTRQAAHENWSRPRDVVAASARAH